MTAREHHPQLIILDLLFKARHFHGKVLAKFQKVREFWGEVAELFVAPDESDGRVTRDAHEPSGGIVRQALQRPRSQRPAKRVLNHVLGKLKAAQSEDLRQVRDHLPRLMTEKMVNQSRYVSCNGSSEES